MKEPVAVEENSRLLRDKSKRKSFAYLIEDDDEIEDGDSRPRPPKRRNIREISAGEGPSSKFSIISRPRIPLCD
jgi:hypothetical protein